MTAPRIVGVVGAGTMGAGIAQLAAQSGLETVLHDPVPEALERGVTRIEASWSEAPGGGRARAPAPGRRARGARGLRAHHRGRARAPGAQGRAAARARRPHRGRPRDEHLVAAGDRGRRSVGLPGARRRDALLQPAARHAARRGRRRRRHLARVRRRRARGGRGDGPPRRGGRRRDRVPREPVQPPVLPRGAAHRPRGSRDARAGRPHLPAGRRLPHGAVRAHGPRRRRRRPGDRALVLRAELPRAALAPVAAAAPDGRRRPPRPQGGPRLVRVPRRAARAARGAERARARRGRRARRHRGRAAGRDRAGAARAGRGLARRGTRRRGRRGAVHRDRRRRRRVRAAAGRAADAPVRGGHARRAGARRAGGRLLGRPAPACRRPAGAHPRRRLVRGDRGGGGALRRGRSGCTSHGWATRRGSSSRGSWRRS